MHERILYNACPLCNSIEIFNDPQGDCNKHDCYNQNLDPIIQWMDCLDCGHQFTSGYYSNDTLNSILSKTATKQKVGYEIERQRNVSSKIIDKVIPFKSNGIWLNIGFGNGLLIFTAEESGFIAKNNLFLKIRIIIYTKVSSWNITHFYVKQVSTILALHDNTF